MPEPPAAQAAPKTFSGKRRIASKAMNPKTETGNRPAIEEAFDGEARDYARRFSQKPVPRLMRARTHALYAKYLKSGQRVLDLNCGPGDDLAFLQSLGLIVTALDLSPEMLRLARQRAPTVHFLQMDYNRIDAIDHRFEAICSNFGGLNTQNEFGDWSADCRDRLSREGLLFVNIMTRYPALEILEGMIRFRHFFRRARKGGRQTVRVGGRLIPTWYFDPHLFYRQFFRKHFRLLSVHGLGILLPPPYLNLPAGFPIGFLDRLEKSIDHLWPCNKWGDHAMLVMRARSAG